MGWRASVSWIRTWEVQEDGKQGRPGNPAGSQSDSQPKRIRSRYGSGQYCRHDGVRFRCRSEGFCLTLRSSLTDKHLDRCRREGHPIDLPLRSLWTFRRRFLRRTFPSTALRQCSNQALPNVVETGVISGLTVATSMALEVKPSSAGEGPSHEDLEPRVENFPAAPSISNTVNSGFV